jgi:hypothetical protein
MPVLTSFATGTVDGSYLARLSGEPCLSIGATRDDKAGSSDRQALFLSRVFPITVSLRCHTGHRKVSILLSDTSVERRT